MRGWAAPLVLAVLAVGAAGAVKRYSAFTLDDAFIGFRYAENIAEGRGFVYNEGERELGTTTPVFILTLAGLKVLGMGVETSALILGLLSFAGTVVLSWRIARRLGAGDTLAFLLGVGLCGLPPLLRDAVSGMETATYAFLTLLVIDLYLARRELLFCAAGAAVFLLRPDGALVLAACGLHGLLFEGDRVLPWARRAGIVFALCLPWFLFSFSYFGLILPNSGFSKLLQMEDWGHFTDLIRTEAALLAAVLPLVLLGYADGWIRDRRVLAPGLFLVLYLGVFSLMSFPACHWYLGPVHAPLLLMAALGSSALLRSFTTGKAAIWAVLGLTALYLYSSAPEGVRRIKKDQVWVETHHGVVGKWLAKNSPPDAYVACDNIGYIGYWSGRRILDVTGLIHREVREGIARTGNRRYALESRVPEFIAMQDRGSSPKYLPQRQWFERNGYREVLTVPYDEEHAYRVWRRPMDERDEK